MSNARTQKTQDQENDQKEKENDQALEQIDNDTHMSGRNIWIFFEAPQ